MKTVILARALLILGGLFLFSCTKHKESYENEIILRVNSSCELTAGQLADQLARRLKDFNSLTARSEAQINSTKGTILNDFIVSCLTEEYAKSKGIFVRKEALDAQIKLVKGQYPDDIAFRQSLIEAQQTFDEWVKSTKEKLLERLVVESLRDSITKPTPEEIKNYYNQNTAQFERPAQFQISQIVLDTEDQAKLIESELKRGKKFSDLAKKFSISPEGPDGGDLGWIERGVHEMFDPAFRLGIGQRTGIIKTPFGYHILMLTGRRPAKTIPLKDSEKKIQQILMAQREQDVYSKWLEAEILRARVYKNEEVIRAIKVFSRSSS